MIYYFLALLVWIAKILLWVTIIGIPIERYLAYETEWFECPFSYAAYESRYK